MSKIVRLIADGTSPYVYHAGGNLCLELVGSFGGGTAKLVRADTVDTSGVGIGTYDYPPTASVSFTAANSAAVLCNAGWYAVTISGSTTPALDVYLASLVN